MCCVAQLGPAVHMSRASPRRRGTLTTAYIFSSSLTYLINNDFFCYSFTRTTNDACVMLFFKFQNYTKTTISGEVFALTFHHLDESNLRTCELQPRVFIWDPGGRNRMWLWVSVVNFVNVDCMFVCAPSIFGMLGPSQLTSVHSVLQFPTGLHVCWTLSFHWAACSTAFFRAFSLGCMWGRFDW